MARPPHVDHIPGAQPVDPNLRVQAWSHLTTDAKLEAMREILDRLTRDFAQVHADSGKVHKLLQALEVQSDGSIEVRKNLSVQSDADITFS